MPNNKPNDVLTALLEFAEDCELDEAEAREELVRDGVDVPAFLLRVREKVGQVKKAERLRWQSEARQNQKRFQSSRKTAVSELGRSELLSRLAQINARSPHMYAHHKRLEELTDEDLRTALVDLMWLEEQEGK